MHRIVFSILLAALAAMPAAARSSEPDVPGEEEVAPRLDQKACRDRLREREDDIVENDGAAPREEEEDQGDRLARNEGVICPAPEFDPDIHAPEPRDGGNMPVIPPPGGDPAVRPR